jgi:hypothetical protein
MNGKKKSTNNGHNNGLKQNGFKRVTFTTLKIRDEIAADFKERAMRNGMDYSDYLDALINSEYLENMLKNTPYAETLAGLIKHIAKKASEPASREYGFIR